MSKPAELAQSMRDEGYSDEEIVATLKKLKGPGIAPTAKEESPPILNMIRQGLQGLTFGTSDELGATAAAWLGGMPNLISGGLGDSPADVYADTHTALQDERNAFKSDHPAPALAAELAGGLATGGYGGAKLAGTKLLSNAPTVLKLMGIGGLEGGIYGAAAADRGERAEGGALGAGAGAVLSPVAAGVGSAAGSVLSPVARAVGNRVKHAFLGSPGGDARGFLAATLAREGIDNIDQLASGPKAKMATLADVSQGARGALEGLVSDTDNPGIMALADDVLTTRNKGLTQRVFSDLDEGLGLNPSDSVKASVDAVKASRGSTARKLYGEAKNQPLAATDKMKRVLAVPEVEDAIKTAQSRMPAKRANNEVITQLDVLDEAKRVLDDEVGSLIRSGKSNRARDLIKLKNTLVGEIDEQIPDYKAARNAYAGDSALLDAAEAGKRILRDDVDYLDDLVETMSESELTMFRLGAKKAIREKMMMAREGTNSMNRVSSQLNLERMKRAFPSEEAFNSFKSDLDFEAELFDTARVLHNSKTAVRLSAQKEMRSGLSKTDADVIQGDSWLGVAKDVIKRLVGRDMSPEAKAELGRMVLTPIADLPEKSVRQLKKSLAKQHKDKEVGALVDQIFGGVSRGSEAAGAIAQPAGQGLYGE